MKKEETEVCFCYGAVHSEHVFVESRSVIRVILNLIWINLWRMGRQMAILRCLINMLEDWLIQITMLQKKERIGYSKASKYTASSCTDLDNARFWIGSKKFWDARFWTILPLAARFCMILHKFCTILHYFWCLKLGINIYFCSKAEAITMRWNNSYLNTTVLS